MADTVAESLTATPNYSEPLLIKKWIDNGQVTHRCQLNTKQNLFQGCWQRFPFPSKEEVTHPFHLLEGLSG